MLELEGVSVAYRRPGLFRKADPVTVVRGVDLWVGAGEVLALVGESGCGKSTLARAIVGLHKPVAGRIHFDERDVHGLRGAELRSHRRELQMVFQDTFASLSPRTPVGRAVSEPLEIHSIGSRASRLARVLELLEQVGLGPAVVPRLPGELSGGQLQRVAIARALALGPRLLVADEPVAALDVSVQAQVLNLLRDLVEQLGLACLFIAHDLAVVAGLADRVAVMHRGSIVEVGSTPAVLTGPEHPYTRKLLEAVPRLEREPRA